MAKTFNRAPVQVNTPNSNDIKNYFFNHFNWKGVNTDKNFLTVDQETFADSKNVYVNGENILRSRPSIKRRKNIISNHDILDIWNINNVIVIFTNNLSDEEYPYKLYFYSGNEELDSINVKDNDFKFVVADNKIFIFSQSSSDKLYYFDLLTKRVFDSGVDSIYIPKTTFNAAGIKTEVEDKNVLTNKERSVYLYNSEVGIATEAYGKSLTTEIDGKKYSLVFDETARDTIVDVKTAVPEGYEVIVSDINTYMIYSPTHRSFSYSATGRTFTDKYYIDDDYGDILCKPKFSRNGRYIIVGTSKGIYFVQVVIDSSTGENLYPTLTDIRTLPNCDNINSNFMSVGFDFEDIDSFAIAGILEDGCHIYRFSNDELTEEIHYQDMFIVDVSYNSNFIHLVGKGMVAVAGYDKDDILTNRPEGVFVGKPVIIEWIGDTGNSLAYKPNYYRIITDIKCLASSILISTYVPGFAAEDGWLRYDVEKIDDQFGQSIIFSRKLQNHDIVYSPSAKLHRGGNKLLTEEGVMHFDDPDTNKLLISGYDVEPVAFTDYIYYTLDNKLYTSNIITNLEFEYISDGDYTIFHPDYISYLSSYYFAKGNILYISEYREEDDKFKWYIPEQNKHVFDKTINSIEPISTSEMGIFFDDEIWYSGKNEAAYTVIKSKLQNGVLNGSNVITSYDGSRLMFCTRRGFVGMTYQDFIASTDQVLSFLSDPIYSIMEEYCKTPTKLFQHNFWVLLYKEDSNKGFIFDTRNNSWWPVEWNHKPSTFIIIDDDITILSDSKLYKVDTSNEEYYDYDGSKNTIHWYVVSQKLHLSASNYYKHIVNMTLSSVIDSPNLLTYYLTVTNYRDNVNTPDAKIIRYKVHTIKTHVQRLNHPKVNEFQYRLETDMDSYVQMPLSISDLTVKYKITGQVR